MIVSPIDIRVVVGDDEREEYLINRVKKIRTDLHATSLTIRSKPNKDEIFSLLMKQKVFTGISVAFTGSMLIF